MNLNKFDDTPYLLDLLVSMEDVLDSLDLYVYKNWIHGIVVEGPIVRRYWLDFSLKYPYDKMPDPRASKRLMKSGIHTEWDEISDTDKDKFWIVKIKIPRRLIVDMNANEMDFYDDEVDMDDVSDAKDSGISNDTAVANDGGNINV